jgi:MSHA biogenesis protein MshP
VTRRRQRGMSLVVAIFLIVVVASLSAFAVATTRATRDSTNLQLLGDRALFAARAGAEWGGYRALRQNFCPLGIWTTLPALTQGALRGFVVRVQCTRSQPQGTYFIVDITAEARWNTFGSSDYAFRSVTQRFSNAAPP